jgi:glycosyltransferase involved in cell wall biosynthesis
MLVSVVIPTFNGETYVAETLTSVLDQTHRDLEVLVVDDGSTDRTLQRVREVADERVRIAAFANGGVAAARNRGLAMAEGEFVAFVDQDDLWRPAKLSRQLALIGSDPHIVAVGAAMQAISGTGKPIQGAMLGTDLPLEVHQEALRQARMIPCCTSSLLVRTEHARRVEGFDETAVPCDERELMARLAEIGAVRVVMECLGSHRMHSGSQSHRAYRRTLTMARFIEARRAALREGRTLTVEEFKAGRSFVERRREAGLVWFRAGGLYAAEGQVPVAAWYLGLALLAAPRYVLPRIRYRLSAYTATRP